MTHEELVRAVARRAGLPAATVTRTLDALIMTLKRALQQGATVRMRGFLVLETRTRKYTFPVNGEKVTVMRRALRAKPVASFRAEMTEWDA